MGTAGRDYPAGTLTTAYEGAERTARAQDRDAPASASGPRPGDRIGRYVVEEQLGQGGMGVVVAAHDPELNRQVALKLVRPDVGDRAYRARLVREARAMAKLEHPNVVRVYDAGEVRGEVFVAMELVRGETLGRWLRTGPPWREVVARFIAAGRGLAAAHHAGLVHRDFKPDNVLVRATDGRVCVTDFGLAVPSGAEPAVPGVAIAPGPPRGAEVTGESMVTRAGAVVGTPAYMAPEQRRGEDVDARADVFSFCVALHEGLHGVRPFVVGQGGAPEALEPTAVPDRTRRPTRAGRVPRAVRRAIRRGLALDPAARWPAIDPLLIALERASRRRGVVLAAAAAVAAGAIAAIVVATGAGRAPPPGSPHAAVIAPVFSYDRATRVTFAPGCEARPAFLPDGRVVYAQRAGASSTLRVTGGGDAADSLGPGTAPAVSPSGRYLAALDGTRVVIRDLQHPAAPARPQGSSTGALAWLNERELVVGVNSDVVARAIDLAGPDPGAAGGVSPRDPASPSGGGDRVIGHLPAGSILRAAAVGSNGRVFGVHRADVAVAEDFVIEILPDGTTRDLRRGVYAPAGLRYRAASNKIYFVQKMNSTQYHLFVQPADGVVEPTPLTSDTPPTGGFDLTPDGRRLVFSTCAETASIVRIGRDGAITQLTARGSWRDGSPTLIDATSFVYTSTRGGELQVWLHDASPRGDRPLTGPESSYPALSPDHRTLAYAAYDKESTDALVVRPLDADTPARRLTGGHIDRSPRFTADGAALLFLRQTATGIRLHRVAVTGGPAHEVVPDVVRAFDLSPAGTTLVLAMPAGGRDHLRLATLGGTDVRDVPGAEALGPKLRLVRFHRDGTSVVVVDGDGTIVEVELATGRTRTVWSIEGSAYSYVSGLELDADGSLIAALVTGDGDLWVADGRF